MSEWTSVALGELCDKIGSGATPKGGSNFYHESGTALFRSQNILDFMFCEDGLVFLDDSQANTLKNVIVEYEDVLLNITGDSVARCCMAPIKYREARVNQHVLILRVKRQRLLPHFLMYQLLTKKNELLLLSEIGGTRRALTKKMISDFCILLPSIIEQKAIAEVLSSIDDKIDLLNRQNETLEAMAQTLFRKWFIEEADESWGEVSLTGLFDFKEGPGIRNWQYVDDGYPFINIRLIKNKELDVSSANCVSHEEANGKYDHFKLAVDDFVMSTSGTLGKVAIVRSYHLPLMLNTSVIRFRPKKPYLKSFMYQYLQSSSFNEYLINAASGSVQLNFGPKHLKVLNVQCPPRELLEQFEKQCGLFYKKINSNYYSIRNLSALRDTLLSKLMSGEVRVKLD